MHPPKPSTRVACCVLLALCCQLALADGGFNGVYGLRFNGTFDPAPSCSSGNTAFIFMEELDSVLMWEGDELNVDVVIEEVCFDNAPFDATFSYSMTTPDSNFLMGTSAEFILSGLESGGGLVARTSDNGVVDGSRILRVQRDRVSVTGSFTIESLRDPNALSVEIIDPPNQPPIAVNDLGGTLVNRPTTIAVLANDVDPNPADEISIASFSQPTIGEVQQSGNVLIFTPPPDLAAVTAFDYLATDGKLTSNSATVSISVVARADDLIFEEDNED